MKHIRIVVLGLILSFVSPVFAAENGTHTVVGFLSMQKGRLMSFFVNPGDSRLNLNILNPNSVVQKMNRKDYYGLVRVQMSVLDQVGEEASVQILKIQPVRARRVPTYDGNWTAVPSGGG